MRNYKPTWLRLRIILTGIWPKVLAPPTANGGAQVTPARGYDLAKIGGTLKTGDSVPTYEELPDIISNRVPFRGNSVSARYNGTEYQVMSYNTIIASINWPERWWIDTRVYSKTTSRIQNIVREIDTLERLYNSAS